MKRDSYPGPNSDRPGPHPSDPFEKSGPGTVRRIAWNVRHHSGDGAGTQRVDELQPDDAHPQGNWRSQQLDGLQDNHGHSILYRDPSEDGCRHGQNERESWKSSKTAFTGADGRMTTFMF